MLHEHELGPSTSRAWTPQLSRRPQPTEFFQRDITDPHLYDLVLKVDHLRPIAAAETIVAAYSQSYNPSTATSSILHVWFDPESNSNSPLSD